MVCAKPSWAPEARSSASSLVRVALVITTPMVLLVERRRDRAPGSRSSSIGWMRRWPVSAHAGDQLAARGIDDLAEGVDGDDGLHDDAGARRTVAMPRPPFMQRSMPSALPTVAPVPAPTDPSAMRSPRASAHAAWPAAASGRAAASPMPEVVEPGRADERDARVAGVQTDAALAQVAHHPVAGGEAEDAAAGEQHAVDQARVPARARAEDVGLARAGRAAADGDAADGAGRTQHHRAAGRAGAVRVVADQDAELVRRAQTPGHRIPSRARWSAAAATMRSRPNGARWLPLNQWMRGSPQCCQSACGCSGGTMRSPRPAMIRTRSFGTRSGKVSGEWTRYMARSSSRE